MDCCDHQYSTSLLLFIDAIVNDCLHEFALLNSRFISFSAIDYIRGGSRKNSDILMTTPIVPHPKIYDYIYTYKHTNTKET